MKNIQIITAILFSLLLFDCKKENPNVVTPIPPTPVVSIVSPTSNEVMGDSVLIQVSATDDKGIVKVEIYIDNQIPNGGTLLVEPYTYIWAVDALKDSSAHTIYAKAYDADDNKTSTPIKTVYSYTFTPTQLQTSFLGDTSVSLSWKDNSKKETGFEIERKINNDPFVMVKTVEANIITTNVSGTYHVGDKVVFRIRAFTITIKSNYSNVVIDSLQFPAPNNLSIAKATKDSIVLVWQDNSSFETGFDIYQGSDINSLQLVKSVLANSTTCILTGSFDDTVTYFFRVQAKSLFNKSNYSNLIAKETNVKNLIFAAGGTFQMGSNEVVDNASPIHTVTVSSFYIRKTEVTQIEWRTIVDWKKNNGGTSLSSDPNQTKGDSLPVDKVNWNDVQLWLSHLNEKENTTKYRLPTEAEWEFAARGGNNSQGFIYSGGNNVNDVSWNYYNSGLVTHPVGRKLPNEIGIYDMSGNVYEWCSDWYGAYSSSVQTNPTGPASGSTRVLRGGGALHDIGSRVTIRGGNPANISPGYTLGFRYILEK